MITKAISVFRVTEYFSRGLLSPLFSFNTLVKLYLYHQIEGKNRTNEMTKGKPFCNDVLTFTSFFFKFFLALAKYNRQIKLYVHHADLIYIDTV